MAYGSLASVYDRLMEDMPYPRWIKFALECWNDLDRVPRHVVDLGCGTGTVSLLLAGAGHRVTGIDLSSDMLAVAASKSLKLANPPHWLQQDISEWALPERVDAVISFCDCFNYLTEEREVAQAFARTCAGLEAGGTFIFDVLSPYQFRSYAARQPFFLNEKDIAYIWTCGLDEESLHMEHQLTIFAEERNERFARLEEVHVQRAYPAEWLERQLLDSGFSSVRRFADFERKEPTSRSRRIFFVAVK